MRSLFGLLLALGAQAAVSNSGGGFFAQFVDGAGWKSRIVLRNLTNAAVPYRVEFRDANGATMDVQLADGRRGWFVESTLPTRGSAFIETLGSAQSLLAGYARVSRPDCFTDDRGSRCTPGIAGVTGALVFQQNIAGRPPFEASIPLDATDRSTSMLFDNTTGVYTTSVAILNTFADVTQRVRARFRDESGSIIGERVMEIPPRSRIAAATPELIQASAGRRGTLFLESENSEIIAFGLLFNSNGPFSTLLAVEDR